MYAGMMRNNATPPKTFFRLLTMYSNINDVKLVYFTPDSVDYKKQTVKGKVLEKDQIKEVQVPIPKFIDVNPHYFNNKKHSKLLRFLKETSELSINTRHVINKDNLVSMLKSHPKLNHLAIPSLNVKSVQSILDFIEKHQKIVLKPINSLKGKNVEIVEKIQDDTYRIEVKSDEKYYSENEIISVLEKKIKNKKYIIQKYIHSRNMFNDPVDCRVHLEKNGNAKWEIARMFIRVGSGQKVVSNINAGGFISNVKPFLETHFPNNWKEILRNIKKEAKYFAYEIEKYNNAEYMDMGLDVGIDENGSLYLFEVNSFPIVQPQRAQIARLRGQYYAYRVKRALESENGNYTLENHFSAKITESEIESNIQNKIGRKLSSSNKMLAIAAYKRGITFEQRPKKRFIMKHGRKNYLIKGGRVSTAFNTKLAVRLSKYKNATSSYLRSAGFSVPDNALFTENELERAWNWAKDILPVVLKPNDGIMGKKVFVNIDTKKEFKSCFKDIIKTNKNVLIEKFVAGDEYRFTLIQGKVIAIAYRKPANVVGDKKHTIKQLIELKNIEREKRKNPLHKKIAIDAETKRVLKKQRKKLRSKPKLGETIYLRNNSNVSTGGDAIDMTDKIDSKITKEIEKAIKSMPGMKVCGVDVIINKDSYNIIEINAHAMLAMHHYPWEGKPREVIEKVIDAMFPATVNKK